LAKILTLFDETVRVAKTFLEEHPEEQEKLGEPAKRHDDVSVGASLISRFLNREMTRVR
jgi:hypothetical protein